MACAEDIGERNLGSGAPCAHPPLHICDAIVLQRSTLRRNLPVCSNLVLVVASIRGSHIPGTATGTRIAQCPTQNKEFVALRTKKISYRNPPNMQPQMGPTRRTLKCSPEMEQPEVIVDCGGTRFIHCSTHGARSVQVQQPTCAWETGGRGRREAVEACDATEMDG